MGFQTLQLEIAGEIATMTLNRPEKRNAISPEMIAEILSAFDEVASSCARVLIVTGEGKAFCSGMDLEALKALATQSPAEQRADTELMAKFFRRVWSFPKPTIAAVNGHAIAGGCGLATLCDFTIAVPEAKFGYPEVRIGFLPAVVSIFLVRQIGEKNARNLLLTGKTFDAAEAHRLGLISEIVPAEQLNKSAKDLAATLLAASPTSLLITKKLLCDFAAPGIDRELELAVTESARIRSTDDFREGLSSFLKNAPHAGPANKTLSLASIPPHASATISIPMSDFVDHVVRVRYAETDKMSIVYYANYFIYFEIGRVEYMRQRGLDYRRMELEDDSFTVVAEAKCRYRRPARYDDPLRIRTRVTSAKSRVITFGYEILHDETKELLVTGETIHVVCSSKGRPKPLPEKYRKYFDFK